MATPEEYAAWIVENQDKKGTPDFNKVAMAYQLSKQKSAPPPSGDLPRGQYTTSGERETVDKGELVAGNPVTRFALGAAAPLIGGAQLGMRMFPSMIVGPAQRKMDEQLATLEAMKQRGMAGTGDEGVDWLGMAGTVLNPAGLGVARALPTLPTLLQRTEQGALFGAGTGATMPVTGAQNETEFTLQKLLQGAVGAGVGAGVPVVTQGISSGTDKLLNLLRSTTDQGQRQAAGRLANEAAGPRQAQVLQELDRAQQIVPGSVPTAGEAATRAGSAEFAGLQRAVRDRAPSDFDAREMAQNAARLAQVRSVGKDQPALDAARSVRAENAAENYNPALMQTRVSPQSQTEVMENAVRDRFQSRAAALQDQGRFATRAAEMAEREGNFYPVAGFPRVTGRATEFPERIAEAQGAARSVEPIVRTRMAEEQYLRGLQEQLQATVGLENRSLHEFLGRPSVQRAIKEAADSARETGQYFPQKSGDQFTVANLQRIKQAISDDVAKNPAVQGLGATQKREITGTVDQFTRWLSNKSPEWAKARLQYAEDSLPINQMQVGQYLEGKLSPALTDSGAAPAQRAATYAQSLRDAPGTIKRATGAPRYDSLAEFMSPQQVRALESVSQDLARRARYEQLGQQGEASARRMIGTEFESPMKGMQLLERTATIVRGILNRMEGRASEKTLDYLAKAMQDPAQMAAIMRSATQSERTFLLQNISAYGAASVSTNATGQAIAEGRK